MLKHGLTTFGCAYKQQLEAHPLRTKMATSACLFSFGDFICQKTEAAYKCRCSTEKTKSDDFITTKKNLPFSLSMLTQDWDMQRTMRQGVIGGLMLSPGLHFFLTRVSAKCVFPSLSRATGIGLRVAVHQACMMPFIQFTLLFASGMMMAGTKNL